jgi:myxalamid-type polyketide synthase MxaD
VNDFLKQISGFSPKRLLLLAAGLDERVRALESRNRAAIAIIGIGCRFPGGVRDAETYWSLLREGRDAITEVPLERWDASALYDPDAHASGRVATRWGGFVDSPDLFDAAFFGIAPVEARVMDPQQRLLLEVSWEALEDAAIVPAALAGSRTGVFVGVCNSDYAQRGLRSLAGRIDAYFAQGASHAIAAGRISYFLDLRGPSVAIDTACSSSLVAVHQACQSLRLGETDLALAGGANLLFIPEVTMALSRAQMMAPDGRCKAFSAAANGFVRGDGCGMVALKRLDDAQRDEDRIIAVIRGTATNQDGRSSGITAPNGPSQEAVIRAALTDAGVPADAIGYVEAHGTGTSLGDVIELRALEAVLGQGRTADARLPVGSVKSNFGHAESAAGVAGLIKLALSLERREIPASLHCSPPNPGIDWQSNRLRVPTAAEPWRLSPGQSSRVGAVSSFGFSGTNAHLIIGEGPAGSRRGNGAEEHPASWVVPLSARSERALRIMAAQLADRLREAPALTLEDAAFTHAAGRTAFAHRAAIRVESKERLIEELSLFASGQAAVTDAGEESGFFIGAVETPRPRVAFLFSGQGGERTGMGLSLLKHSGTFRAAVAEVEAALAGVLPTPIEVIFRNEHGELGQPALVQPALYAFEYGLARVWQSFGIEPHIVAGHSMGEIVACTLAEVMSVPDALLLVAARSRLTQELGDPGGMVAVAASEDQALAALKSYEADVGIAAVNGPASVVISGRNGPLELATLAFERAGVRVKRLNIAYGSHSPAMDRVLPAFYEEAAKVHYQAPRLPILADLTGDMVTAAGTFDAQYFTSHLRRPIQFHRCLERLKVEHCGLCIEMGPRPVLTAFGKERPTGTSTWIASANGREDDFLALQSALAEAFAAGAAIDWKPAFLSGRGKKVALPTYPFDRQRYWIDEGESTAPEPVSKPARRAAAGLAGSRIDASVPIFEAEWEPPYPWHLDVHRVGGQVTAPATAYLSLAWNAFGAYSGRPAAPGVLDLTIVRPLKLSGERLYVQTVLTSPCREGEPVPFRIASRPEGHEEWTLHATGRLETGDSTGVEPQDFRLDTAAAELMRGAEFYRLLEEHGVQLGAEFRALRELWYVPGAARGLVLEDSGLHLQPEGSAGPHPALLDACFQVLGAAALSAGETRLHLVTSVVNLALQGELRGEMYVEADVRAQDDGFYEGSFAVRDRQGSLLAHACGIRLRPVPPDNGAAPSGERWLYEQVWEPAPLGEGTSVAADRHWMIFGAPGGLAGMVVDRLLHSGQSAQTVADLEELDSVETAPSRREIVDLRALGTQASDAVSAAGSLDSIGERAEALTLQSVALWQNLIRGEGKLWLFTQGAQGACGASRIEGAIQSPLWGLARCATLEHPQRLRRIVDLDADATPEDVVSIVMRELLSEDDEEQAAYCGRSRLAFRLKPSALSDPHAASAAPANFRKDGSYLLTGGAGGLGMRVAEWLVQRGAGTLVLATRSRTSLDARESGIEALRRAGADVIAIEADVADSEAMQRLFARFGSQGGLPPLRGIFHMAAEFRSSPLEAIDSTQIHSVFRAKVEGTCVLQQLARAMPLDFFLVFSSTAAIAGAGGLGSYAAANSFVESMASFGAAQGLPCNSISWGTWRTMRLAGSATQEQYVAAGMLPMADESALAWLEMLLHRRDLQQPVVASIDWARFVPLLEARRQRNWLQWVRPRAGAPEPAARPSWTVEPGESRFGSLERVVRKEAGRVLGFRRDEVPAASSRLADLGLDSLMAVSLRNRLQKLTGCSLPATFAFEHPTPSQMAMALEMMLWGPATEDESHPASERDEMRI